MLQVDAGRDGEGERRKRIYAGLCAALSGGEQAAWEGYTAEDWGLFAGMAEAEGVVPPRGTLQSHGQEREPQCLPSSSIVPLREWRTGNLQSTTLGCGRGRSSARCPHQLQNQGRLCVD